MRGKSRHARPHARRGGDVNAVVGLLLAAGRGRRFGSDKLMHRMPDGMPIAVASARRLASATDRTVAVVRPHQTALCKALAALGVELVEAADADHGMGNTLAAGIRATQQADGWVVALGDMPCVLQDTVRQVAQALRGGASIAAPFHLGQRGHPVGFARQWLDTLLQLAGDEGARHLLRANGTAITRIGVDDPGCLFDVDTLRDIEQMHTMSPPTIKGQT